MVLATQVVEATVFGERVGSTRLSLQGGCRCLLSIFWSLLGPVVWKTYGSEPTDPQAHAARLPD